MSSVARPLAIKLLDDAREHLHESRRRASQLIYTLACTERHTIDEQRGWWDDIEAELLDDDDNKTTQGAAVQTGAGTPQLPCMHNSCNSYTPKTPESPLDAHGASEEELPQRSTVSFSECRRPSFVDNRGSAGGMLERLRSMHDYEVLGTGSHGGHGQGSTHGHGQAAHAHGHGHAAQAHGHAHAAQAHAPAPSKAASPCKRQTSLNTLGYRALDINPAVQEMLHAQRLAMGGTDATPAYSHHDAFTATAASFTHPSLPPAPPAESPPDRFRLMPQRSRCSNASSHFSIDLHGSDRDDAAGTGNSSGLLPTVSSRRRASLELPNPAALNLKRMSSLRASGRPSQDCPAPAMAPASVPLHSMMGNEELATAVGPAVARRSIGLSDPPSSMPRLSRTVSRRSSMLAMSASLSPAASLASGSCAWGQPSLSRGDSEEVSEALSSTASSHLPSPSQSSRDLLGSRLPSLKGKNSSRSCDSTRMAALQAAPGMHVSFQVRMS